MANLSTVLLEFDSQYFFVDSTGIILIRTTLAFFLSFTQIRRFSSIIITLLEVDFFVSLTFSSFLGHRPRSRIVAELLDNLPPLSLPVHFRVLESSQVLVTLVTPWDLAVRVLHDRVQAAPLFIGEPRGLRIEGLEVPPELLVQPRLVQLQGDNVGLSLQAPVCLLVGAAL